MHKSLQMFSLLYLQIPAFTPEANQAFTNPIPNTYQRFKLFPKIQILILFLLPSLKLLNPLIEDKLWHRILMLYIALVLPPPHTIAAGKL